MTSRARRVAVATLLLAVAAGCAPAGAAGVRQHGTADTSPQPAACSTQRLQPNENGPVRFSVRLGDTSATVTATAVTKGYQQWLRQPELAVSRGAGTWQPALRPAPDAFQDHYNPLPVQLADSHRSGIVCLARFVAGQAPMAVVSVYAGGAHCCTSYRVFDPATRTATRLDTGNMGARVQTVGSHPLFRTADDTFSYAFASFAYSGNPIQLMQPTGTGFRDVTRTHATLIRDDAATWWHASKHSSDSSLGFLAAWAGDQELLGHDQHVWTTLHRLNSAGKLSEPKADRAYWPQGTKFIDALRRFLTKSGYRSA